MNAVTEATDVEALADSIEQRFPEQVGVHRDDDHASLHVVSRTQWHTTNAIIHRYRLEDTPVRSTPSSMRLREGLEKETSESELIDAVGIRNIFQYHFEQWGSSLYRLLGTNRRIISGHRGEIATDIQFFRNATVPMLNALAARLSGQDTPLFSGGGAKRMAVDEYRPAVGNEFPTVPVCDEGIWGMHDALFHVPGLLLVRHMIKRAAGLRKLTRPFSTEEHVRLAQVFDTVSYWLRDDFLRHKTLDYDHSVVLANYLDEFVGGEDVDGVAAVSLAFDDLRDTVNQPIGARIRLVSEALAIA